MHFRWLDRNRRVAAINFLAFGAGPRVCIGMRSHFNGRMKRMLMNFLIGWQWWRRRLRSLICWGDLMCLLMKRFVYPKSKTALYFFPSFDYCALLHVFFSQMTELKLVGCTSVTPERVSIKIKARQWWTYSITLFMCSKVQPRCEITRIIIRGTP